MARTNPFNEAIQNIVADFRQIQDNAPKRPPVPVGQEEVTNAEFTRRWQSMSVDQRKAMLAEPGMRDKILQIARSQNAT